MELKEGQLIEAIKCPKMETINGGIETIYTFSDTHVFKDGILYAEILERKGLDFKMKLISENKHLNGVIRNFTVINNKHTT